MSNPWIFYVDAWEFMTTEQGWAHLADYHGVRRDRNEVVEPTARHSAGHHPQRSSPVGYRPHWHGNPPGAPDPVWAHEIQLPRPEGGEVTDVPHDAPDLPLPSDREGQPMSDPWAASSFYVDRWEDMDLRKRADHLERFHGRIGGESDHYLDHDGPVPTWPGYKPHWHGSAQQWPSAGAVTVQGEEDGDPGKPPPPAVVTGPIGTGHGQAPDQGKRAEKDPPGEPMTRMGENAAGLHECYLSYVGAGFTEPQALYLIGVVLAALLGK